MRTLIAVAATLVLSRSGLLAQAPEPVLVGRRATVTLGVGNSMGWFGSQAEVYFAGERLSAFGGLGYTPAIDQGDPSGVTVAGGLRGYTPGTRHRGFLELSVSQVALQSPDLVIFGNTTRFEGAKRLYGPGLQGGYQYTALGGFTLMVSAGLGIALGRDERVVDSAVQPILNLGLGYTWR